MPNWISKLLLCLGNVLRFPLTHELMRIHFWRKKIDYSYCKVVPLLETDFVQSCLEHEVTAVTFSS